MRGASVLDQIQFCLWHNIQLQVKERYIIITDYIFLFTYVSILDSVRVFLKQLYQALKTNAEEQVLINIAD